MQYMKSDTFIELCYEHNFDVKAICNAMTNLGSGTPRPSVVRNRIANYRRKGLLPLDSGNNVDKSTVLRGLSTLYDAEGNVKQQWVKSDVAKEDVLANFELAVSNIVSSVPSTLPTPPPSITTADIMTVYPIGDAHIGLLAHAPETGADSDLSIIEHNLVSAMTMLVSQANPTETAYIADLGK